SMYFIEPSIRSIGRLSEERCRSEAFCFTIFSNSRLIGALAALVTEVPGRAANDAAVGTTPVIGAPAAEAAGAAGRGAGAAPPSAGRGAAGAAAAGAAGRGAAGATGGVGARGGGGAAG